MGFGVVLAPVGVPLERAPLLQFGIGVPDAVPGRGLTAAHLPPGVLLAERRIVLRFLRRGTDLSGELVGQAPVTLIDLGSHLRAEPDCSAMPSMRIAV